MSVVGPEEALFDLARWLDAVRPYLPSIVLVGGFAPVFYRHHTLGFRPSGTPMLTTDADFAAPPRIAPAGDGSIAALSEAGGFVAAEVPGLRPGDIHHKVFHARHGELGRAPVHIEFITPLQGRGEDRRGNEVTTRAVQPGLCAQTVRFVELLLAEPISVDAARVLGFGLTEETVVRVAHPAGFVLQKARIRARRPLDKRAKDMAYIVDVARVSRPLWSEMRAWIDRRRHDDTTPTPWLRDAARPLIEAFEEPGSYGCVEAAKVYSDAPGDVLTPEIAWRLVGRMNDELQIHTLLA